MMNLERLILAGIDDAGRGSIIGPLVIAGLAIRGDDIEYIKNLGVRDSKLLTQQRRLNLAEGIKQKALKIEVRFIEPFEIDRYVGKMPKLKRLNYLEGKVMGEVAAALKAEQTYVDASDVDTDRFRRIVAESLNDKHKVIAAHKAERKYVVVAAASIIAKTERDNKIERMRLIYGDFGTGYPHDPVTINFLKKWINEKGAVPDFARKSWKTWRRISSTDLTSYI